MPNEALGFNCLACGERHFDTQNLRCIEAYTFQIARAPAPHEASHRELFVLAALACGIEGARQMRVGLSMTDGAYWEYSSLQECIFVNSEHPDFPIPKAKGVGTHRMRHSGCGWCWDPLRDEGDQYRLARALELNIDFAEGSVSRRMPSGRLIQEYFGGDHGDEGHAIMRAAIQTIDHYYG